MASRFLRRSGRSSTSAVIIESILQEDRRKIYEEIAKDPDMSISSVFRIMTEHVNRGKFVEK